MKAPARLGLYGLSLAVVFAVAGFTANTVVPEDTVQAWVEEAPADHHEAENDAMNRGAHEEHEADATSQGLGLAQDGYQLTGVSTPTGTDEKGELAMVVTGPDGQPVSDFALNHEQEMHLIAVRADGQEFRHVHPERDASGTWSIPWQWDEAGTYRIFADFVPTDTGEGKTLSTTVQVTGDYDPVPADQPITETAVGGFDVTVRGDLVAGEASELTMTITRAGEPVTELEPYLGAFGHLVALRDGDLAYLHVHPHRDAAESDESSGPEIVFEVTAPTEGRYLLYLDFKVHGQVHTAPLVIDTTAGDTTGSDPEDAQGQNEHEEGTGHDH